MKIDKNEYLCWFFINQNLEKRAFEKDEGAAAEIFLEFLSHKNYGSGIRVFRFDIYVEPEINFGRHRDAAHSGYCQLSANIDYRTFVGADADNRVRLLLNTALVLCTFLSGKMVLPKGFDSGCFVSDLSDFLRAKGLLIPEKELEQAVIKPFETTRFNFVITSTAEVDDDRIHYDLNRIQDYLNNELSGRTFGKVVRQFDFGYEIADSQGRIPAWKETVGLKRYSRKYKNLLVVKQFDYRQLKNMTAEEQFAVLKARILDAIDDVSEIRQLPKDFPKDEFREVIADALSKYSGSAEQVS